MATASIAARRSPATRLLDWRVRIPLSPSRHIACSSNQPEVDAMRRAITILIFSSVAALVLSPTQARAEGYISPWVAANAGTGINGSNLGSSFDNGRAGVG